ncbi:P-loop containing nucleoside triphosphate hydrolase protein, partial [Jimgerdemannia flammicorona]
MPMCFSTTTICTLVIYALSTGKTIQVIAFLAAIFGNFFLPSFSDPTTYPQPAHTITPSCISSGKKGIPENVHERKTAIRRASLRGEEMPNLVRVLIVCPGSVLYNWQRELDTWGYFEIGIFHGVGKEGIYIFHPPRSFPIPSTISLHLLLIPTAEILKKAANGFVEVVLTSFDTARSKQAQIDAIPWSVLIVDEVHKLKEPKTKVTQVLKALKVRRRFGLTVCRHCIRFSCYLVVLSGSYERNYRVSGTSLIPSMVDTLKPGFHTSRSGHCDPKYYFHYVSPYAQARLGARLSGMARYRGAHLATGKLTKYNTFAHLLHSSLRCDIIFSCVLLPRCIQKSSKLPKKEDKVIFCPLTATQRSVYERILGTEDAQLISRKNENCDCGLMCLTRHSSDRSRSLCCYKKNSKGVSYKDLILQYITILQKISNHLALIMPDPKDDKTKRQKDETLSQIAFPDSWKQKQANFFMYSDPENCGKWKILQKLLKNWERQESKVLLFSYSVRLLNMLEKLMISEGYAYCRLDGTTPVHQRMDVVDKFNTSPSKFVFLISTRAGGVGLNVTSANIVVVFDPNWNPSHDLQAQDRAFRIGQRRDVKVYRLIAAGSLEELVYGRQIYKQQQMNVGYTGSNERRYFTGVEGDANRK